MDKVDILFMSSRRQGSDVILSVQRDAPLPVELTCTGAVKLAQRWMLEFCTELGSIPYQENRGCVFLSELRSGRLYTETDVFTSFSVSAAQVAQALAADQQPDDPLEGQLVEANLVELRLTDTTVRLRVEITNASGQTSILSIDRPV